MKREQIKELKGMISQAVADDRMSQSCAVEIMDKLDAIHEAVNKQITDKDIKKWALYDREYLIDYEVSTSSELNQRLRGREEGAKAMRDGKIVSSNRDY